MEINKIETLLTILLLLTVSCSVAAASSLRYQTLQLNPLPSEPTLSWPESELQTETETETATAKAESTASLTVQLHHLDALSSNKTPDQLFSLRLRRDIHRVKTLTSVAASVVGKINSSHVSRSGFSGSVISGLNQGSGEYFTRFGVGTPPRYVYMVLDTGSDVMWLQCAPCTSCYSQSDPVFDPRKSRSFSTVKCGSPLCRQLVSSGCKVRTKTCLYEVTYGDGSFTGGNFVTETLTFRGKRIDHVAIGCGHDNEGLFVGAAGLLGLGRGSLSFPSQTGPQFNRKFSYCLVDRSASTKPSSIIFGDAAVSRSTRFTPLLTNRRLDSFYYLDLMGISVGGKRVKGVTASLFKINPIGDGGIIIDSGTSVTRLTQPAYIALRNAFRVGASRLKKTAGFSLFDTCFDLTGKSQVTVPTVVFHFRGADVSLPATNYLIPVDTTGTFCFAFAGTTGGLSIFGNVQQQGFRVVYDLAGYRVGFAPRGCV